MDMNTLMTKIKKSCAAVLALMLGISATACQIPFPLPLESSTVEQSSTENNETADASSIEEESDSQDSGSDEIEDSSSESASEEEEDADGSKVGRNDPCPCGSGKKYKKCCGK